MIFQVSPGRIIRILSSVFPKYFAIISRVREDVRSVGQEGGKVRKNTALCLYDYKNPLQVVLDIEPRLRATFPKNAVKKKIKVKSVCVNIAELRLNVECLLRN